MKKFLISLFIIFDNTSYSQSYVTIEDLNIVNNDCSGEDFSPVIQIPRDVPTIATFKNNSITYCNPAVYLVMAGEDGPNINDNHLDGAVITGNKLVHTGYNLFPNGVMHGIMAGYQINQVYKWNYFDDVGYTVVYKSGGGSDHLGMINTSGGHSYNITKNTKRLGIKGTSGVRVYNNTFYCDRSTLQDYPFIKITSNNDDPSNTPLPPSSGTKIKNNIFYSTHDKIFIQIYYPTTSLDANFECDYNIYYVENDGFGGHLPTFTIEDTPYTWAQWRALGYDAHSVILDPKFIDRVNIVPKSRLDLGTNLGFEFATGLSVDATWVHGVDPATESQNGTWQVGAYVYKTTTSIEDLHTQKSDFITVVSKNNIEILFNYDHTGYKLSLYNLSGQLIQMKLISGNSCRFGTTSLAQGFYLIVLSKSNVNTAQKVFIPG